MVFEVRKIQVSDVEGFRAALDSVVNERKYLRTLQTPSHEDVEKFVSRNIDNNYSQYVALIEEKIVGWADIIPYKKESINHVGLLGIGVISNHRGCGIGKALLSRTIQHSREIGLIRIELEVFANNSVAIELYEQLGFEHEGTKRNARYLNNQYEDVCIMGKCYI